MDSYLIRYFLAVVEAGNFSRAAAQANVSQPTLSVGIAKLERQLGVQLFDRTNRRVHLTDAGSRFLVRARRIVHEFNQAIEEVSGLQRPRLLRVGLLATVPTALVAEPVRRHQEAGAPERIEILDGSARELANLLDQGRIDVALTLMQAGGRFEQEPLFTEGYALALARTHRLAEAEAVEPEELAAETMIVRRQCEALSETSRFFTAHNVRPEFAYRSANDDKVLALVCAGLGLTVMPNSYRHPDLRRPRLAGFEAVREVGFQFAPRARELVAASPFLASLRAGLPGAGEARGAAEAIGRDLGWAGAPVPAA
ncbi:MAG: LysR family transcriptional regulator [Caulobacteraceae bacterium]|nr:LysR family transcriptional regulator [Caulobacteraceae bacterium]